MFPTLQLGPLSIQMPGLLLILALWLGLSLAEKYAPRRNISVDTLYNLVFTALITGLVGARLAYILQFPNAFAENLTGIFSLNPSLLDPFGGLAGAALASLIYGKNKKLTFWNTLDGLTPLFAVLAIGVGMAHFASGDAFGVPTSLPWGIDLWGEKRHPSQVYEIIATLATLGWLWREFPIQGQSGVLFLHFAAITAGYTLFLQIFRGDSILVAGNVRAEQVIAWIILAIILFVLNKMSAVKAQK